MRSNWCVGIFFISLLEVFGFAQAGYSETASPLPSWTGTPPKGVTNPLAQNGGDVTFKDILAAIHTRRDCAYKPALIEFTIGADGNVSDLVLLQSSGVNDIDEALKTDIAKLHYSPATKDGEPVAVRDRFALHANPTEQGLDTCSATPSAN